MIVDGSLDFLPLLHMLGLASGASVEGGWNSDYIDGGSLRTGLHIVIGFKSTSGDQKETTSSEHHVEHVIIKFIH